MNTVFSSRLLKLALSADAVVSGGVAALQLLAAGWLSEFLLLPKALLVETGLFLVGYTILLVLLARRATVWSVIVGTVIVGNMGWAVACIALLATGIVSPNMLGISYVLVQAIAVLVFAAMEYAGLRASGSVQTSSVVGIN